MHPVKVSEIQFRTSIAISKVYIKSNSDSKSVDLKTRISEILKYCNIGIISEISGIPDKYLTIEQVHFLVRATGDWDSDSLTVIDVLWNLVMEKRVSVVQSVDKSVKDRFSWKELADCHESQSTE